VQIEDFSMTFRFGRRSDRVCLLQDFKYRERWWNRWLSTLRNKATQRTDFVWKMREIRAGIVPQGRPLVSAPFLPLGGI
jgi:hypothetical protein